MIRADRLETFEKALVLCFFSSLFIFLTSAITDPDFWWHLASGRWTWENRSLMDHDPFGFVSFDPIMPFRKEFILQQYWLSQLIFYGIYALGGLKGVILLRASVFTALFALLFLLLRGERIGRLPSALLISASVMAIVKELTYIGDKPQMWSSLFAIVVLFLLERLRKNPGRAAIALPAVMLLWANMHGGFLLGDVIIALYLAVAAVSRTARRDFTLSCVAALVLSAVNPQGITTFVGTVTMFTSAEAAAYHRVIIESQSLFSHARPIAVLKGLPFLSAIVGLSLVSLVLCLWQVKRARKELLLVYALMFVMGYSSLRFLVFFAVFAPFFAAVNIRDFARILPRPSFFDTGKNLRLWILRLSSAVLLAALAVFFLTQGLRRTALAREKPYFDEYGWAVKFIRDNDLRGNMFNDYNPGGYLIWQLTPDVKTFIDGRVLSLRVFDLFKTITARPNQPMPAFNNAPAYQVAFEQHGVDLVLIPGCDRNSGVLIGLSLTLLKDSQWSLVYADRYALIFLKNTSANRDFIRTHSLLPDAAYDHILGLAYKASQSPHIARYPAWRYTMAVAYYWKGNYASALERVNQFLALSPNSPNAQSLKRAIERNMGRGAAPGAKGPDPPGRRGHPSSPGR